MPEKRHAPGTNQEGKWGKEHLDSAHSSVFKGSYDLDHVVDLHLQNLINLSSLNVQ